MTDITRLNDLREKLFDFSTKLVDLQISYAKLSNDPALKYFFDAVTPSYFNKFHFYVNNMWDYIDKRESIMREIFECSKKSK